MNTLRLPFSALYRALRVPGLLAILYAVMFLLTLPLGLAFRNVLHTAIGNSGAYETLLTSFDFTVFGDFMKQYGSRIAGLISTSIMFAFLTVPLGSFLAGGIITTLRESERRFSLTSFFAGCARYFGRFIRLLLIFATTFIVLALLAAVVFGILIAVMPDGGETEMPLVGLAAGGGALFAVVLFLFVMVVDYAKVIVAEAESFRMVSVALKAVRFVGKNFFRVFVIHLVLLVVVLLLVGAYWLLDGMIGMVSPLTIVLMGVIQQLFVVGRMWLRVALFSAEIGLYQSVVLREAPFIDTPPPSDEPAPLYA